MSLQFVTIRPLSVNECFGGKKFKTAKYIKYEADCFVRLKYMELPPKPFELKLEIGVSNSNADSDNVLKPFIDILQKKYKFNDRNIMRLVIEKEVVPKGREYIGFEFFTYKKQIILTK